MSLQRARRMGAAAYAVIAGGPLLAHFFWQFFVDHPGTHPPAVFVGALLTSAVLGGVGVAFGQGVGAAAADRRGRRVALLAMLFPVGAIVALGGTNAAWWVVTSDPVLRTPRDAFAVAVAYGMVYGFVPLLIASTVISALIYRWMRARPNPPL